MAIFASVARASKEIRAKDEYQTEDGTMQLKRVYCIHYPICFQKNFADIEVLFDSGSEVNAMTLAFASKFGLRTRYTNIGAQKIDGSTLQTFKMVLANFQIEDKLGQARFFQKSFLLAETTAQVMLSILFLTFSNTDVSFFKRELIWKFYTIDEVLPITKRVELIDKKKFAKTALDMYSETFIVHVVALEALLAEMPIHSSQTAQVNGGESIQIVTLN